jgi:hypothetical protein
MNQEIGGYLLWAEKLYHDDKNFTIELKNAVFVVDSTTINLCLSLFPWAKFRKNKGAIKLHKEVMRRLLLQKASLEAPKEIWIDYDDSVITLFGNQEEGKVGYNARYKGRPSYKVKVAFIAESGELVKLKLYNGLTHSNSHFLEFHKAVEAILPRNYVLKGVRADKGFFDQKNLEYFEEKSLLYAIKAPMHDILQKATEFVRWRALDATYSVGELTLPLTNWGKARRFIFIREKLPETKQRKLFPYEYQCIVTNIEDALPEDIWRFYNGRANIENKIDELKAGFAIDEQSQERFLKNQAFALLKSDSLHLINWVRTTFLPDEMKSYEVVTIRRELLEVPGNVVGCGRYEHVRLARERIDLKPIIDYVKEQLRRYADLIVMNRYCEMRC